MSMIRMIVETCIIDNLPIDQSPAYQFILHTYGKLEAAKLIREEVYPPVAIKQSG
jgi:hypothetical protein